MEKPLKKPWDYRVFMGIPCSNEPKQIMGMFTDQEYEKARVAGSLQEWAKSFGGPLNPQI